ncbi:MAG: hypothetical protein HY686_04165 [Chloroflexi bacterium]|nr:hypothetical protein [Chloroflexota bacterium]
MMRRLAAFLTEPRYQRFHVLVIAAALLGHLLLHYATYVPALREPMSRLPYLRLHVLHEAEFLLLIVYAGLVFRLKGGLAAVAITAITSVPFLLTPFIFGREPRPGELRDLAVQVGAILVMGAIISVLYEVVAREREGRLGLAARLAEANLRLRTKNEELEQAVQRLEQAHRQLMVLNHSIQGRLNRLYEGLQQGTEEEGRLLETLPPSLARERFARFLRRVEEVVAPASVGLGPGEGARQTG